jgi:DNA-binding response OmpR family regulator
MLHFGQCQYAVETTNVLIVDSNKSTSRTFKLILQKRGFAVVVAEDSKNALEKIKTNRFDAVVITLCFRRLQFLQLANHSVA